jgi:hypothetical protein
MGSIGKRIVSQGYLLYEYLEDDDTYRLIGIIDSALGGHAIVEGAATDEAEAQEFIETGKVQYEARFIEKI